MLAGKQSKLHCIPASHLSSPGTIQFIQLLVNELLLHINGILTDTDNAETMVHRG